jgi:hypothetical protein
LSQFPSFNEGFTAFGWVFDDVDDVTQVDDIGWGEMIVGLVVRVPTRADVSLVSRSLDITAMTAAIVENVVSWLRIALSIASRTGLDRSVRTIAAL